jgi:hypothetical protein
MGVRPKPSEAADLPGNSRVQILKSPSSGINGARRELFLVRLSSRHLPHKREHAMSDCSKGLNKSTATLYLCYLSFQGRR